jgi:hypothetical protein
MDLSKDFLNIKEFIFHTFGHYCYDAALDVLRAQLKSGCTSLVALEVVESIAKIKIHFYSNFRTDNQRRSVCRAGDRFIVNKNLNNSIPIISEPSLANISIRSGTHR